MLRARRRGGGVGGGADPLFEFEFQSAQSASSGPEGSSRRVATAINDQLSPITSLAFHRADREIFVQQDSSPTQPLTSTLPSSPEYRSRLDLDLDSLSKESHMRTVPPRFKQISTFYFFYKSSSVPLPSLGGWWWRCLVLGRAKETTPNTEHPISGGRGSSLAFGIAAVTAASEALRL